MGILSRLNALDDQYTDRPATTKTWDRLVRWWWLGPVLACIVLLALTVAELFGDARTPSIIFVPFVLPLVQSGYLYNERMRQLGRTPRLVRRPPPGAGSPPA